MAGQGKIKMDGFFDTNVIFNYSNYHKDLEILVSPITKKCYFYIINKKERFLVCWAVLKELSEITKKRARIHKTVIEKLQNPDYPLEVSISKKDLPFAKKLYEQFKNRSAKEIAGYFRLERRLSEIALQHVLAIVDETVIPVEHIDNELVNKIYDIIPNHADCKILASAIQSQEKREIFLFVTVDTKDLDPKGYEFLKEHFKINYPRENYKFPKLKNLCFED